ncbi:flagellar basal body P-ring protein FlgI [Aeoliella sp. ICT_H6.2]|uniref:Flagellar basal body P-ring protein FlgI n=1 Tax=Aeoliella straminimaris TaxID=2954799 RepID=A0A9X2F7Q2_9BACT|nr:flagellar basal body P-ring protein FlgI [Aeoliella straminimaris]MCO6043770.1 flagellar basal body P-ring protein FlgI [Aeoliella straminimaris]
MILPRIQFPTLPTVLAIALLALGQSASAETELRNICRLKGQEENTLTGLGLVVGLNGTGEAGDRATMEAIARVMDLLGSPVTASGGYLDPTAVNELKKIKNVALVIVRATVPATGVRRGEQLDCTVSALNGKSLYGGQLSFAALQGPNPQDGQVYATCAGGIHVESIDAPTVGFVHKGCRMEADVRTPFYLERNGEKFITLVLDPNHASFHTAANIAERIRMDYAGYYTTTDLTARGLQGNTQFVRAIDATNIEVKVPTSYRNQPVQFAYELLEQKISEEDAEARVVINKRTGTVVISGDVRIGDVIVVHNNIVVEAGTPVEFTQLVDNASVNPSLQRLVTQLNNLKVNEQDVIEIIQRIAIAGKLHGKLIIE